MQIPAKWTAILAAIQTVAPEAFLAGGALRDLDLGRAVKDLDVFVSEAGFGRACVVLSQLDYAPANRPAYNYGGADPSMAEAREYQKPGELSLNLISLATDFGFPSGLYRFDLGLCQIGFDGRELVRTGFYVEDAQHQRMTVRRCGSARQLARTMRRFDRLAEKYPGWTFHVPAEFGAFAFDL